MNVSRDIDDFRLKNVKNSQKVSRFSVFFIFTSMNNNFCGGGYGFVENNVLYTELADGKLS